MRGHSLRLVRLAALLLSGLVALAASPVSDLIAQEAAESRSGAQAALVPGIL